MCDKKKPAATLAPKNLKSMRQSTVGVAASSRNKIPPPSAMKDKNVVSRLKVDKNTTITGVGDISMFKQEGSVPDFAAEDHEIAYGQFLRAMLADCLLDKKIEREETKLDVHMMQLTGWVNKTIDQLDKTNRRMKDISFVVEQKRLIDLRSQDCSTLYEMTEKSKSEEILQAFNSTEQACIDQLKTKNIDFGFEKESGHKQLLDAVNEAVEGLEQIKKHSNLDVDKFKEYQKSQTSLEDLEKDRYDLKSLKSDFDAKFPQLSEKVLMLVSDDLAKMMNEDDDDIDDNDD